MYSVHLTIHLACYIESYILCSTSCNTQWSARAFIVYNKPTAYCYTRVIYYLLGLKSDRRRFPRESGSCWHQSVAATVVVYDDLRCSITRRKMSMERRNSSKSTGLEMRDQCITVRRRRSMLRHPRRFRSAVNRVAWTAALSTTICSPSDAEMRQLDRELMISTKDETLVSDVCTMTVTV